MKNKFNLTKTFNLNINNCIIFNLFILFVVILNRKSYFVNGLKCICNRSECDIIRPEDCPGKGIIVWDPCKCCKVCAKTLGEACGGPGGFSGKCEPPLHCISKPPVIGNGICLESKFNVTKVNSSSNDSSSSSISDSDSNSSETNERSNSSTEQIPDNADDNNGGEIKNLTHKLFN